MSEVKDLIALFCLISMLGIYSAYGFLINYHSAYIKLDYPQYSKQFVYTSTILLETGIVVCNYFLMNLITRFGISKTIQIGGNLAMFTSILMIFSTHIFGVYLIYFLFGCVHQIFTFTTVFYLGLRYDKKLIKYTGYVFTGSSMAYLLWSISMALIMNPDNFGETRQIASGSLVENIFPSQVTDRFPIFCGIFGITNLVTAFLVSWTISTGDATFSEVSLVLGSRSSSVGFNEDEKREMIQNLKMKSKMLVVFTNIAKNKSISESFLQKNKKINDKLRRFHTKSQQLPRKRLPNKKKYLSGLRKSKITKPVELSLLNQKGRRIYLQ